MSCFHGRSHWAPKPDCRAVFLSVASAASGAATLSAGGVGRRAIQRRAVEAVIWRMPAVNFNLIYRAALKAKTGFNQIVAHTYLWEENAVWNLTFS